MRDGPGAAGGVGDGGAGMETLRAKAGEEVAGERGFAAEQMGAAGDVEHQAVGEIEADERRVAVAPVGDVFEKPAVRRSVGGGDGEAGMHGAGIGERHACPQAEALRRIVHGDDPLRALDHLDDDERRVWCELSRRGLVRCGFVRCRLSPCGRAAAGEAIGREPPQPQGEIAP